MEIKQFSKPREGFLSNLYKLRFISCLMAGKRARKKQSITKRNKVFVKSSVAKGLSPSRLNYNSRLALKDLILFSVLSIVSFIIYTLSNDPFYEDLFYLFGMVLVFIAAAFLIAFLALYFLKRKD